jgi:hypothetical protein
MFRFGILAGIAYFLGQLAYNIARFIVSAILITLLLGTVFILDAIRLSSA